jgi:AcrR family transcriptional regulator
MPLNRFLNLPQEERGRVLEISKKQFSNHGYDATSLNLLLKELDISKGQFYYWFEDKADLFFTIMQEGLDALQIRLNEHGQPNSKSEYWSHMRQSRLISEQIWNDNDFVEIGKMISQQIPSNHPIYERLMVCSDPLRNYYSDGLKIGQEWGLVRTDLSVETLGILIDGVSDGFYKPMLDSYSKDMPPTDETLLLHDLLGRTLRLILQPLDEEEKN